MKVDLHINNSNAIESLGIIMTPHFRSNNKNATREKHGSDSTLCGTSSQQCSEGCRSVALE